MQTNSRFTIKLLLLLYITSGLIFTFTPGKAFAENNTLELLEAVRLSLKHEAKIDLGKLEVSRLKSKHTQTQGEFDTILQSSLNHGETPPGSGSPQKIENTFYKFGLIKQLRSGVSIQPYVQTSRSETENSINPATSNAGAYFKVTIPLLQGLGKTATAGQELAASQDVSNSRYKLKHSINQVVKNVAVMYWDYVLAYKRKEQLREAEKRAKNKYRQIKELVENNERPPVELQEAKANINQKRSDRISGERRIIQSRHNLGLAMGIPFERIESIPPPQTEFEQIQMNQSAIRDLNKKFLIRRALNKRYDLKASKGKKKSANIMEEYYQDKLSPQLDMGMRLGYQGLKSGGSYNRMGDAFFASAPGKSWQISLTYNFPVENRASRGRWNAQKIQKHKQLVNNRELIRTIRSNIHTELARIRKLKQELTSSKETVDSYKQTVSNQFTKYKMGMATQNDLIDTQDKLTDAVLAYLSTQNNYASSLIQLRFYLSSLVNFKNDQARVEMSNLVNLPQTQEKNRKY